MNLAKQFREFGVLNSINPISPDAQVVWYNLMQCFNMARWSERKLVVRTQTLENICGMTRKRLAVSRNTLIQRGLIQYYPSKQASGSPSYELMVLYDEQFLNENPVFPTETQEGTHRGTQEGTQNGTHTEHLLKLNKTETILSIPREPFFFDVHTNLPQHTQEAAEIFQFTMHKKKNTEYVLSQWKVFLLDRMSDPEEKIKEYRSIGDLTSYFLNWIKTKPPQNEINRRTTSNRSGTSEDRINALKEW